MTRSRTLVCALVSALVIGWIAPGGVAQPTGRSIPLTQYGGGSAGSVGAILPLSSTSFLVATRGPDGAGRSGDESLVQVTDLGLGATPLVVGTNFLLPQSSRGTMRLTATTALVLYGGADGVFGRDQNFQASQDDGVAIITGLGSPRVSSARVVHTDPLFESGLSAPERLTAHSAVLATVGPDGDGGSTDDSIAYLTQIGGGLAQVRHLAAPCLTSRPTVMSPTQFLVSADGPDARAGTDDDVVFCFLNVGVANEQRIDLTVPNLYRGLEGRAVRLSPTRALVCSAGDDESEETADDIVYLLDELGGRDTVTPIPVPFIASRGGGIPCALSETVAVVTTGGADGLFETADDALLVLSDLGQTNQVTEIVVGNLSSRVCSRPVRLTPTSCVVATGGQDAFKPGDTFGGRLDEVVALRDVAGTNQVVRVTVPGLEWGSTCSIAVASAGTVLVASGGDDGAIFEGGDDVVSIIQDLDADPRVETVAAVGDFTGRSAVSQVPRVLGRGRAALASAGADRFFGSGDDAVHVIDEVAGERGLTAEKIVLRFNTLARDRSERFTAKATLDLDGAPFADGDVTISIGNAAQTIAQASFQTNSKGVVKYVNKPVGLRFIRLLRYKPRTGKLVIRGIGRGTGVDTTDGEYVVLGLEWSDQYFADVLQGTTKVTGKNKGIKAKATR